MEGNYAETIDTSHLDDSNRKSTLTKQKKIDIRSNLKQLIDLAFPTNEKEVIIELDQDVNYLLTKSKEIYILYKLYHINLLRKEETKKKKKSNNNCDTSFDFEISLPKQRKHPFSERAGSVADMVVQFYTAKIALADESEEKKEVTSIKIYGDDQSC